MSYQIISDGSCDLPEEYVQKYHLKIVPFYVSFDGETYKKEIEEISVRDFYQEMVDRPKIYPKSSLPSVNDYMEAFRPYLEQGQDIICICITTKFSGSYNSAMNAKELLAEKYPQRRVAVIDAAVNTVLQGLLVLEAAKMKENGLSLDAVCEQVNRIKETGRILFTIGSFDYLVKGGRVGRVIGVAGSTLGIKPLINLHDGEIFPTGIFRSREKGKNKLIEQVREHFEKSGEKPESYEFVVGYGYDIKEAESFRDALLASLKSYCRKDAIGIFQIGAAIGVHTGPYPIGIGLLKRYDA